MHGQGALIIVYGLHILSLILLFVSPASLFPFSLLSALLSPAQFDFFTLSSPPFLFLRMAEYSSHYHSPQPLCGYFILESKQEGDV